MDDKRIVELQKSAEKSGRAATFAKSSFWLNDLGPMLKELREQSILAARWRPTRGGNEGQAGLTAAYYSGRTDAFEELYLKINNIIQDGEAALVKLREIEEKKKLAEGVK